MNCRDAQELLSLYLYGELDFEREEQLEAHLGECPFCQLSLAREKGWHSAANSVSEDVPLDVLAECRQQLQPALNDERAKQTSPGKWRWSLPEFSWGAWAPRAAFASLLVLAGFGAGRLTLKQNALAAIDPSTVRIEDLAQEANGMVRLTVAHESEVTGRPSDALIHSLLLAGTHDSKPAVRFYSYNVLNQLPAEQSSQAFRDVLISAALHDPAPAIRLEALDGLRHFSKDQATLNAMKLVLTSDEDAGVRSQAIDILAPESTAVSADTAAALQELMRSTQDDYVHTRAAAVLRNANLPVVY